jgi:hypothetical protein
LHELFIETMLNPFAKLNAKIDSQRFEQRLTELVRLSERRAGATPPSSSPSSAAP